MLNEYKTLVTGGSSGIGLEIAKSYAKTGASVWLVARDETSLKKAKEELEAIGQDDIQITSADLTDNDNINKVVEQINTSWTHLDVLVNNAGIGFFEPFREVEMNDLHYHFALNAFAPFYLTQQLHPLILESEHGSVINISSHLGERVLPLIPTSVYSSTKGAINMLTKELAVELGPEIRVNAISPGTVKTPQVERNIGGLPKEKQETFSSYTKLNYALERIGEPSDISGIAVFLASERAKWISGQIINIDGGLTAT